MADTLVAVLSSGGGGLAYERAALAVGRLDASGALSSEGLRKLLVLRCAAVPLGASSKGMIALLRRDREGSADINAYHEALEKGAARARGGVVPAVAMLDGLIGDGSPGGRFSSSPSVRRGAEREADRDSAINALIRDASIPPVLKAVAVSGVLLGGEGGRDALVASLAATLLLCVGGATADAWLALPLDEELRSGFGRGEAEGAAWLTKGFDALAIEARAAERGLGDAHRRIDEDRTRVREALARSAYSALDLLELLARDLVINVPDAARALGQTPPTAGAAVARLVQLGIAEEVTGRRRARAFVYRGLVDALAPHAGIEPWA